MTQSNNMAQETGLPTDIKYAIQLFNQAGTEGWITPTQLLGVIYFIQETIAVRSARGEMQGQANSQERRN